MEQILYYNEATKQLVIGNCLAGQLAPVQIYPYLDNQTLRADASTGVIEYLVNGQYIPILDKDGNPVSFTGPVGPPADLKAINATLKQLQQKIQSLDGRIKALEQAGSDVYTIVVTSSIFEQVAKGNTEEEVALTTDVQVYDSSCILKKDIKESDLTVTPLDQNIDIHAMTINDGNIQISYTVTLNEGEQTGFTISAFGSEETVNIRKWNIDNINTLTSSPTICMQGDSITLSLTRSLNKDHCINVYEDGVLTKTITSNDWQSSGVFTPADSTKKVQFDYVYMENQGIWSRAVNYLF